jgi:hypothetical protein
MSPFIQDYHIYADETLLRGPIAFAFGALICTPRRAQILAGEIRKVRREVGYFGELKWNKTSEASIALHTRVVKISFDDRFARFSLMNIKKGHGWRSWGQSEEERFFKAYYLFLMSTVGPFSRYDVYLDERPLQKRYRWKTLHFLMNKNRRQSWDLKRKNIRTLAPIDSKSSDLLQLADLLLGSQTTSALGGAKLTLRREVEALRLMARPNKVTIQNWTPKAKGFGAER